METKDIAPILKERNAERYNAIIVRAANNGYHDFKFDRIPSHPEYGDCMCPKIQLVDDLSQYPELNDIRNDVIAGKYDETPDDQDGQHIRQDLINDGAADEFFKMMNLEPPTAAERLTQRPINN